MTVAGLGFRADASVAALRAAFNAARNAAVSRCSITGLAVLDEKADIPAIQIFARETGLPVHFLSADALAGIATPTQSPRILARFGTGSLAEALALAAAGPGAHLIATRHTSPDGAATAAIAQGFTP